MKDLTVGKPGRVLLAYSLPLFGSIIFQQLYNLSLIHISEPTRPY